MNHRRYILFITLLMTAISSIFVSCAGDDDENDVRGVAVVHGELTTRSAYTTPVNDCELINSWWIVFVDDNNIIAKVVERESFKTYAVKSEDFVLELEAGTYNVYSFANISMATVAGLAEVSADAFAEGKTMPALDAVNYNINNLIENGTLKDELETPIPMSGKKSGVTVTGGEQSLEFEVIRMMAKVEFIFRNDCKNHNITLKSLTFRSVNKGLIPLMPDYSTLAYNNEKDPVLVGHDVTTDSLKFDFTDGTKYSNQISLSANSYSTESFTHCFYVRESLAESHPTKHFKIEMVIDGRGDEDNEYVYTISGKDYTGLNRNDYLQIPIRFTDYKVDLAVNFYPPIGGFSPVILENKSKELYCRFGTEGDFEIIPTVYDTNIGSYLAVSEYDYELIEVDDPNSIFVSGHEPSINAFTGEITGTLNSNEGTAGIYVHISVPDPENPEVQQDFWRWIYIIRKNS